MTRSRYFTTVVVGPDGKIYDLRKTRFPLRDSRDPAGPYFPVDAYTIGVNELVIRRQDSTFRRLADS